MTRRSVCLRGIDPGCSTCNPQCSRPRFQHLPSRWWRPMGLISLAAPLLTACLPSSPQPTVATAQKQKIEGVFITTLAAPAGWQVKESRGLNCRFFQYAGTGDYVDRFNSALQGLVEEGKKLGAQAFVNARISSESHEMQGSKWHTSMVQICGDFVVLM